MGKEQFIGTWKLVSSEIRTSDGQLISPLGRNATGTLMYDTNGRMSAQIMRPGRPIFTSGDQLSGTSEEIKTALEGFIAYFGTYEVNEKECTITHRVEGSLFPNWIGTDQRRFFQFSGGRLTITTPPMPVGGRQSTVLLIWERVS